MQTRLTIILFAGAAVLGCVGAWQLALRSDAAPSVTAAAPAVRVEPGAGPRPKPAPAREAPRWFSSLPPSPAASHAIYGRNGRPIDLGGLNVAQYIADRMGLARRGDVKAAYEVYQAVSICAANADPVTDFNDPAERAQFMSERAAQTKLCEGMSPAQVQERLAFLDTAARAGHIGAQIDYYMEGPYGRDFDIGENPDDPIVTKWKADALTYLKDAGNKCDHFALALLSTVYDAGQLTARDPGSSMAYAIAAAVPRKKPVTEAQLRERFGEDLSAADFASAEQRGASLASAACGNQALK